jgi:isopenicillin-N N-acyltransferase-like protein
MAHGSGVSLASLVSINVRDDLTAIRDLLEAYSNPYGMPSGTPSGPKPMSETTSAFFSRRATFDHVPVLAQARYTDQQVLDEDLQVYLEIRYPPAQRIPTIFMVTDAGMLSGSGMNSDGMAVTANALFSSDDHLPMYGTKIFPVTCLERCFLECSSFAAIQMMCNRGNFHTSKNAHLVTDTGSSISLEISPERVFRQLDALSGEYMLHANHYQSFEAFCRRRELQDRYRGTASSERLSRLRNRLDQSPGQLLLEQIAIALLDDQDFSSVALVMFDTTRRVISVRRGAALVHFGMEDRGVNSGRHLGTKK